MIFLGSAQERYDECLALANEKGDKTFGNVMARIHGWEQRMDKQGREYHVEIYNDFAPKSFMFREVYDITTNRRVGMVGGIIFHGFPDTGYQENFSVIEPQYGWHMHT